VLGENSLAPAFDRTSYVTGDRHTAGERFKAAAIAAATSRASSFDDYVAHFAGVQARAVIQTPIQDQTAANAGPDKNAKYIARAPRSPAFELAVHSGVHIVLNYRRGSELFGKARTQRKVLELQIRGLDDVASSRIKRTWSANADCRKIGRFKACALDGSIASASDRREDFFIIAPRACFCASPSDDATFRVHYCSANLGAAQVYA
jgi:hypothetical protein